MGRGSIDGLRHRTTGLPQNLGEKNEEILSWSSSLSHVFESVQSDVAEAPSVNLVIEKVKEVEAILTLSWHQLEEWQKDNEYILTGYRR